MKDKTSVYVSPAVDRKYRITSWRYELVRNGKYVGSAGGYPTPEAARAAGESRQEER